MKKLIGVLMLCFPLLNIAQEQGIHFEQELTWKQVQDKAKRENKFIFLDCYATWCGPCKAMDNEVYLSKEVGNVFNNKFISVKVQMDKTDEDDAEVRSWYKDAEKLSADFSVGVFPSFLFFSPDGNPLHKSIGYKNSDAFIALAADALNPSKQYYRLLTNYKQGILDSAELRGLARAYKRTGIELSEKIVLDYLSRFPAKEKFSDANLKFLAEFTGTPKLQGVAYDYLAGLSKAEFGKEQNMMFAVAFCNYNNVKVRELCVNYVKDLSKDEIIKKNRDSTNLKFIIFLASIPAVEEEFANYLKNLNRQKFAQFMMIKRMDGIINNLENFPMIKNMIVVYLENTPTKELSKQPNVKLMIGCKKSEKIQGIARGYISSLTQKDLARKDIVHLVTAFTTSTADPGFQLLYSNINQVDLVMNKDYAEQVVDYFIDKEMIHDHFVSGLKGAYVPWDEIELKIKAKYPNVDAYRIVLNSKVALYTNLAGKNEKYSYKDYFNLAIEKVNKYGPPGSVFGPDGGINGLAFEIFQNSTDSTQINIAIQWMEKVIERNSTNEYYLDTYANLLYKIGRVKEGLNWEAKTTFKETYNKMLQGLPTWNVINESKSNE